jgi:Calcium binding
MPHKPKDDEREQRIRDEIIVDSYGPDEQAMGWYYYLDGKLQFPFTARCITQRAISPLKVGEEVKVIEMAPIEECEHEMFVMIQWKSRKFAVPLIALQGVDVDEETQEATEDWQYWMGGDEEDEL